MQISKYYLDFGTKDKKCALNKPVTDKIRIVNTGSSTVRIKFPESQSKQHLYQLTVSPHEFKLKKVKETTQHNNDSLTLWNRVAR